MRLATLTTVLLLAGCAAPDTSLPEWSPEIEEAHGHDESPWSLQLTDCHEGGGIGIYSRDFYQTFGHHVPEPWVLADIQEEINGVTIGTNGDPILGDAVGHWHTALVCEDSVTNGVDTGALNFGWVGIMVEAPDFDPGGADLHFLLSGLSLPEPLGDDLRAQGVPLTVARNAGVFHYALLLETTHDDEEKGIYNSTGVVEMYRNLGERTYRMWMTIEDNGTNVPVYFDWTSTPLAQYVTEDTTGWGCHWNTPMHGPQGFLCGASLATVYQLFDRSIVYHGPVNATLEHAWDH